MKKTDIILDFTPLLDVTLIVIFFFVIFSHFDSQETKAKLDEKTHELDTAIQQAEVRETKAIELEEQLQNEIEMVKDSDIREGSNIDEIRSFSKGENIKIIINMNDNPWTVQIVDKTAMVGKISNGEKFSKKLITILEDDGHSIDDTILCEFIYYGSVPGTNAAYKTVISGLNEVRSIYRYIYISETDMSIGE